MDLSLALAIGVLLVFLLVLGAEALRRHIIKPLLELIKVCASAIGWLLQLGRESRFWDNAP